eukprot:6200851-Prorocentrum_lima.AAC.1
MTTAAHLIRFLDATQTSSDAHFPETYPEYTEADRGAEAGAARAGGRRTVSYTHLRAHETRRHL